MAQTINKSNAYDNPVFGGDLLHTDSSQLLTVNSSTIADKVAIVDQAGTRRRKTLVDSKGASRFEQQGTIHDDLQVPGDKKKTKKSRKAEKKENLKKEVDMDDHRIPLADFLIRHQSDLDKGLSDVEAARRLAQDGPNALSPPKTTPEWIKFMKQMFMGFAILLWIGGALCFVAYGIQYAQSSNPPGDNLYLGIVLVAVVIITGGFSYYQEAASSKVMESFKKLVPQHATVLRSGVKRVIPAENLVVGDTIEVKFGDRMPADVRVTFTQGFKVDNSSLTGESEPLSRSIECTHENPLETKNLAFFSTNVVEGIGKGVVVSVGDKTIMGRIAGLASDTGINETTMAKEMKMFVNAIIVASGIMGVAFLIALLALGYSWILAFVFLIGIIMGNVPEGLLTTVTVILTLTAKRMAQKNCLVKALECVETLGSTSVICSDKTGTLTQNRMTVSHLWHDLRTNDTDACDYPEKNPVERSEGWIALSRVALLCNRAEFKPDQENVPILKRETAGDASESALLKYAQMTIGGDLELKRAQNKKVFEIPFNSMNKFQVSVHESADYPGHNLIVMKGAPERILERCATLLVDGQIVQMDEARRKDYNEAYEGLGSLGERVLGFADLILPKDKYPIGCTFFDPNNKDDEDENQNIANNKGPTVALPIEGGLRFCGLISLIDPPRPAVPEAVLKCRRAGIKVIMVTGDHQVTAKAIARCVNIFSKESETREEIAIRKNIPLDKVDPKEAKAIVVTGDQLKTMDEPTLVALLNHYPEIVFARTSPQQKLIIVEGCQSLDNIVAVTGDGVNDSPALKKSDIGIAMGITGSDVSKQAADMILLDDNFASIVTGIEEGRLIFENLKKTVAYTVTHITDETLPFLLFIFLKIPLPIGTICILWIDLGTDIVPAITLAYEKVESDIMLRPPRDRKNETLVNGKLLGLTIFQVGLFQATGCMFTYFVIMGQYGFKPDLVIGIRDNWSNPAINNLSDSYNQEWTFAQRRLVEITCYTGYLASVVIGQVANIIVCKTRRNSILEQGMVNYVLVGGLSAEIAIIILLSYIPGMAMTLSFAPMRWSWFLCSVPFAVAVFFYGETRKLLARWYPGGFIDSEMLL